MSRLARGLLLIAVALALLGGCAAPAGKPWWTLREADFRELQPGKSTIGDARALLGSPINSGKFPRQGEEVLDYRYPDGTVIMLAWVYFDARGVFKYYTAQPDPAFLYSTDI